MASEVDVCNLALSYLGDEATVASINPPEGSVQAEYCARFYPFARDSLLELHTWGFATKCAQLAAMGISRPEWRFAYAQPADAIKIVAVLPHDAAIIEAGIDNAQPFSCEIDDTGADIIPTNQVNAVARYISLVRDTTKFSPLFVQALAWHLASMLAGPLLKGRCGRCGIEAMCERNAGVPVAGDGVRRQPAQDQADPHACVDARPRRQLRGGQPPRLAEWVEGLMSNVRVLQRSFGGGEISPEMFGRIDDVKYQSGLAICRNFVVKPQGPVENRAGFSFVREVKDSTKRVGLIPFTYSVTQTMVIELGAGYFRFHTHGGTLLDGGTPMR